MANLIFGIMATLSVLTFQASAMEVFRHPDARFSSGEIASSRPSAILSTKTSDWIKTSWTHPSSLKNVNVWLKRSDVLMALDFSDKAVMKNDGLLYYNRTLIGEGVVGLHAGDHVILKERFENKIRITFPDKNNLHRVYTGWVLESSLTPAPEDAGFIYTTRSQPLQNVAHISGKNMITVPEGMMLKPLSLNGSWVLVEYKNRKGWLSLFNIITKLDLTARVYVQGKTGWAKVSGRTGNWLVLEDKTFASLKTLRKIETRADVAFIKNKFAPALNIPSIDKGVNVAYLGLGQKINILSQDEISWYEIQDEQGNTVWYRSSNLPRDESIPKEIFSYQDLTERGIFDIATSPKDSRFKIASARGIFKTTNGHDWTRIGGLDDQNHPVSISPRHEIFVGPFMSEDQGESFQPYLRMDKVLYKISKVKGYVPDRLRLTKITSGKKDVTITLTYGSRFSPRQMRLVSSDLGFHWTFSAVQSRPLPMIEPRLATHPWTIAKRPSGSAPQYVQTRPDKFVPSLPKVNF